MDILNTTQSYTCIVLDKYGRWMRVTSPNNSWWFQQVCAGTMAYPYQNGLFYSPAFWQRNYPNWRLNVDGVSGWAGGMGAGVGGWGGRWR
jgi:hypothetical protein